MSDRQFRKTSRRSLAARAATVLLALALAFAAVHEYRLWRRQRNLLGELVTASGLASRSPAVARDVAREPDRRRAALRAARGLLADELDTSWQTALDDAGREEARADGLDKLERAREIAAEALAVRPASWQAAQVLGATRYLGDLRRRLPMTAERRAGWRQPLLAASALGPGQPEPARFLAAATLSEWARMSTAERDDAVALLRDAFADAQTFDLLAASWLRLAPSRERAFALVPSQPRAWGTVKRFYAERADWGSFARAHERQRDALFGRLEERLALARRRLALGDGRRGRWYALEILEKAPPSHRFAPLVGGALEVLPPGPLGEIRARRMAEWLNWSREGCLLGACPFAPPLLSRMAGLAQLVTAAEEAAAAEMGGDWRAAELLARRRDGLASEWAPYHLLRARRLAAGGDLDGHRRSLERVHADWRSRAAFYETSALSAAATASGPLAANRPRRRLWPADAWSADDRPSLEIYSPAPCDALELAILGSPALGSAIEVSWDGELVGAYAVAAGRPVRLAVSVDPATPHRLTVDPFVHPRLRPGRVRLENCAG